MTIAASVRILPLSVRLLAAVERCARTTIYIPGDHCRLSPQQQQPRQSIHNCIVLASSKRGKNRKDRISKRSMIGDQICPECHANLHESKNIEGTQQKIYTCTNCMKVFVGEQTVDIPEKKLKTPKEMKAHLDKHVVGQEYAKRMLATSVYHHYKRIANNTPPPPHPGDLSLRDPSNISLSTPQWYSEELSKTSGPFSTAGGSSYHTGGTQEQDQPAKVFIEKSNILMMGPTGSGKTHLAETVARYLDVPYALCDCTTLTSAGYVGEDIESVITKLFVNSNGNIDKCQQGIIMLDEVDKIAKSKDVRQYRDVGGEGVQQGLLKILEGTVVNVPAKNTKSKNYSGEMVSIDTTNILFIAFGAFNGLEKLVKRRKEGKTLGFGTPVALADDTSLPKVVGEQEKAVHSDIKRTDELLMLADENDLISFGLIPEFVGRLPKIVALHNLDVDMLVKILTEPENAILKQYELSFQIDGCQLQVTPEARRAIASEAFKKRVGARGLKAQLEKYLLPAMYDQPGTDIVTIIVDSDVVLNNTKPTYIHKKETSPPVPVLDLLSEPNISKDR